MKNKADNRSKSLTRPVWRAVRVIGILGLSFWVLSWVAARALIVAQGPASADAIAVLAGSATYIERTDRAAKLFAEGRAPRILLTNDGLVGGWSADEQRNPLFVERAVEELNRQGVPREKIEVVPGLVANTYEEIVRLRDYASERGWRSILIVTSAYHSRRAAWIVGHVMGELSAGIDPVAPGVQSPAPAVWWMYVLGWRMVPGEYAKLVYYRMHY